MSVDRRRLLVASAADAMAVPRGRDPPGSVFIHAFLEEMKSSGVVRKALDGTGQDGAAGAPPA